jgi:glutaredoxin
MRQKSEKKFKIFKSETGRVVYTWAYQCPKCKKIKKYDFEKCFWALEGGLGIACECKFEQVITLEDLEKATLISQSEYLKL